MTIRNALILAALILLVSLGSAYAVQLDWIDATTAQRLKGVMGGLIVVIFANLVPKTLEPLSETRCDPARKQSLQRFSGWILVVAGLMYSLAWLVLPLDDARTTAMSILAVGVVLVVARLAWVIAFGRSARPTENRK